jgi:hypothetical protein
MGDSLNHLLAPHITFARTGFGAASFRFFCAPIYRVDVVVSTAPVGQNGMSLYSPARHRFSSYLLLESLASCAAPWLRIG